MLNPTNIYTLKKGCENRIFGFPQKYVKTTQDTTQVTFRAFQAKLGPVNTIWTKFHFQLFSIWLQTTFINLQISHVTIIQSIHCFNISFSKLNQLLNDIFLKLKNIVIPGVIWS